MALSTGDCASRTLGERVSEIVYADDAIAKRCLEQVESGDRITIISIMPVPAVD